MNEDMRVVAGIMKGLFLGSLMWAIIGAAIWWAVR